MESTLISLGGIAAVLALVAVNGLFVAAEFAIVKARHTRIAQLARQGRPFAALVERAVRTPDPYVAATQLGITMASLGLGWIGEPALGRLFDPLLGALPQRWSTMTLHGVSAALAFLLITALHIVLGELAPKSVALRNAEATALVVVPPTEAFYRVFRPFIWALNGLANAALRLVGLRAPRSGHLAFGREELVMLIGESRLAGLVEQGQESIVRRVIRLTDRTVGEVMVHRSAVVAVPHTATVRDALETLRTHGYTRLPVYGAHREDIVGSLHAMDVLRAVAEGRYEESIAPLLRPAPHVPETKLVVELLEEMRKSPSQLAVVLEEYGSMAGIVTIEDLVEEVVGDITGEARTARPLVHTVQPDRIVVDAAIDLVTLHDLFDITLPEAEANTLGGFIFYRLQRIPEPGTTFAVGDMEFTVETVVGRRIGRVQIRLRSGGAGGPARAPDA